MLSPLDPFTVCGQTVLLCNAALADAISVLPEQTREEILRYYFLRQPQRDNKKSSKSFSRLTAFAGRVGGGWYSVFMTYGEQDSTIVPKFANRSFCPMGILLGLPPQARLFAACAPGQKNSLLAYYYNRQGAKWPGAEPDNKKSSKSFSRLTAFAGAFTRSRGQRERISPTPGRNHCVRCHFSDF